VTVIGELHVRGFRGLNREVRSVKPNGMDSDGKFRKAHSRCDRAPLPWESHRVRGETCPVRLGENAQFLGDTSPGIQFGAGNDPATKASGGPPLSQGSVSTDVVALMGVHRPEQHRLNKTQNQGFVSETLSLIIM
jgi:hypothetical protein